MICAQTDRIIILHSQASNGTDIVSKYNIMQDLQENAGHQSLRLTEVTNRAEAAALFTSSPHKSKVRQFYFEQLPETKCIYNNTTIFTKMMN